MRNETFPTTPHQVEVADDAVALPQHRNEFVRVMFPPKFEEHSKQIPADPVYSHSTEY